jgi:RNase H-like protein
MSNKWTPAQLKKLLEIWKTKRPHTTDYELAGVLSRQFKKSPESIRWQLRQFHRPEVKVKPAKILLLDIETLPINADVWGTYKQNINPQQIRKDWSILCWSAKWLFSEDTMGEVVLPKEAINRQDSSVLEGAWKLMNDADMIVWQNGDNFDAKKLNTRFLLNGYPPPMFYKTVDTYKVLTENFDFTYNKLDWVADVLGVGRKVQTSFAWWTECGNGNKEYLNKMLEYNKFDVQLTEEVYLKLRPWIKNHPNLNLFDTTGWDACRCCGSTEIRWEGKYQTALGLYKGFRCQKCGAIGRSTLKKFKLAGARVQ